MTRAQALEIAREVLAGKSRSYVGDAQKLAAFLIEEEKQIAIRAETKGKDPRAYEGDHECG